MAITLGTETEITFTNLDASADNNREESASVDLGATSAHYINLSGKFTPTAGAGSATGYVDIFIAWSLDNAVTAGSASGLDSEYTPTGEAQQAKNLQLVTRVAVDGTTTAAHEFVINAIPALARYFSIVTENQVGEALSSTAANNIINYQTVTIS